MSNWRLSRKVRTGASRICWQRSAALTPL